MSKFKRQCEIIGYIKAIDSDLYEVITEGLCLRSIFVPKRGRGKTFLYPADKEYRKEIITSARSDDPTFALETIQALVINDVFARPEDFKSSSKKLVNALGQKVEVEKVDSKSVTLTSGGILTPDKNFMPIKNRQNMAVYNFNGKMPLNSESAFGKKNESGESTDESDSDVEITSNTKRPRKQRKNPDEKAGGLIDSADDIVSFTKNLEDKISNKLKTENLDKNALSEYMTSITSFLYWIKSKQDSGAKYENSYRKLQKYLDWNPVASYYIILEPYMNNYELVDRDILAEWIRETHGKMPDAKISTKEAYKKIIDEAAKKYGIGDEELKARQKIQKKIIEKPIKPTLSRSLYSKYDGHISDTLRDEMRMILLQFVLDIIESKPEYNAKQKLYDNLLVYVRITCREYPTSENNYSCLLCLDQQFQNLNDLAGWFSSCMSFARTTFMYMLVSSDKLDSEYLGKLLTTNDVTTNPINYPKMAYNLVFAPNGIAEGGGNPDAEVMDKMRKLME
jgi:hypothetical protein